MNKDKKDVVKESRKLFVDCGASYKLYYVLLLTAGA